MQQQIHHQPQQHQQRGDKDAKKNIDSDVLYYMIGGNSKGIVEPVYSVIEISFDNEIQRSSLSSSAAASAITNAITGVDIDVSEIDTVSYTHLRAHET